MYSAYEPQFYQLKLLFIQSIVLFFCALIPLELITLYLMLEVDGDSLL